ncbi:hypothetical protein OAN307_c19240 [Octadecabacter antarcticus 307]|uniref:Uncharacterized protein n=1 Tax=Octadecabacter antarcticus 307 TaxID=391626 RepID=M9R730_9RHOB|nr:hypothetical protein OAN307_c19240 [Octadecabacter antarcticus 307]
MPNAAKVDFETGMTDAATLTFAIMGGNWTFAAVVSKGFFAALTPPSLYLATDLKVRFKGRSCQESQVFEGCMR